MAVVLHHSRAKGTDKLVLLGIANHSGDGGAWPSIATLARYANVTERAVQTSVQRLMTMGELVVDRQGGGTMRTRRDRRPNAYHVTVACPVTCDHTTNHRPRAYPVPADHLTFTTGSDTTDGVNHTSPRDGRGEVQRAHGVKHTSPEPSLEPSMSNAVGEYVTGPRARVDPHERAAETRDYMRGFCTWPRAEA